jgi:hypothetical protein
MPGAPVRILAVAMLAVVALVALAIWESYARAGGVEVILRMERVDPRALLSGHYVAIDTTEPLTVGQTCPPGSDVSDPAPPPGWSGSGPQLWIALARRGDHFSAVGASSDRAAAARLAPLLVRGRAYCSTPVPASGDVEGRPGALTLRLGIDRFYANQAEATRISGLVSPAPGADSTGEVAAIVSIGRDGRARLKGLLVQGRRVEPSLL